MTNYQCETGKRKAEIVKWGSGEYAYYIVRMWEHDTLIEDRRMITDDVVHNLSYAQDCAVNWVSYIF